MRKSFTLALTLTAAITFTAPAYAAPAPRERNTRADIVKVIKKWITRVFEVTTVPNP